MKTTTQTISFNPNNSTELAIAMLENERVINIISEKESISKEEAELLFSDTLRFLFLCSISERSLSPNTRLDLGWHHFILCTREYSSFCKNAFGKYIHHSPFTIQDKKELVSNPYLETYQFAKTVFGNLSQNWKNQKGAKCCKDGNCAKTGNCSHCTEE